MDPNNDDKASNTKTNNHKSVDGTLEPKSPGSKRKKQISNSPKKLLKNHFSNTKSNKKKKKKRKKTKCESTKPPTNNNNNNKGNMNGLHKTHTSPLTSLNSLMAQLSNTSGDIDDNKTTFTIDDHTPPFERINKEHKNDRMQPKNSKKTTDLSSTETKYEEITDKIKNNKKSKLKRKQNNKNKDFASVILEQQQQNINDADTFTSSLQYFHNYFDRNNSKPAEINTLLNRIERDLQFIFNDNFLNTSTALHTEKLYTLIVSLHKTFIEYNLSFLLPVCKLKLIELDKMFLSIIKYFNRFKRYHRSPQISKYKQQINKLKNNVDVLVHNIESNCCIILYALIRTKQLFLEFHKNTKLLIFWMELFPNEELEFIQLSWIQFVNSVQDNKSLKKFKTLNAQQMINVLTQHYEVLSIQQFLKYVLEYDSVGAWLNDMYDNISAEINNAGSSDVEFSATINDVHMILDKQSSVIIHDDDDVGSDDGTIFSITTMDGADDGLRSVPTFGKFNSNGDGTVITSNYSTYSTSAALPLSRTSSSSSGVVIECEREEWNQNIKSLEAEISKLKTDNYEYNEKIKEYELRLHAGKLQSKDFFTLQTKFDNHEKISILLKKRCLNLHQQINQDVIQFTQYMDSDILHENKENEAREAGIMWKKVCKLLEFASSEIFGVYQELKELTEQPVLTKKVSFKESTLSPPFIENKIPQTPPTPEPQDCDTIFESFSTPNINNNVPNIEVDMPIAMFRRPRAITFGANKRKKPHARHQSYSVATLKEKMSCSSPVDTPQAVYSNQDLNALKFVAPQPRNHFRNYTSANKMRNKRRKHKRFQTTTLNRTIPTLNILSPAWAVNVAMHNVMESVDDGVSDVISTLSNIDYTFMLNEYDEYYDDFDEESQSISAQQYVNINPYQSVHQATFSVVDPLTILDDKMLTELKERNDFKLEAYEIELKEKLLVRLREMDLMGEGRLDIADFTSACMNIVGGYDDIMEDAQLLFETMQNLQDDMGTIKIMDIVDTIILNDDDEAAKNIKQEIIIGLNLNIYQDKNDNNDDNNDTIGDLTELNVKKMEVDPNQQPYKPIYAVTNGRQKI